MRSIDNEMKKGVHIVAGVGDGKPALTIKNRGVQRVAVGSCRIEFHPDAETVESLPEAKVLEPGEEIMVFFQPGVVTVIR